MKFNKIMLAATVLFGTASFAYAADQGQGKVVFTGSIIDAPCSIPGSGEQEVDLGKISSVALKNGGKSTPKSFDIVLSKCDISTLKTVKTTFTGIASPTNQNLLGISGTASGAGVAITYGGQQVKLGQATPTQALSGENNTLTFAAYLQGEMQGEGESATSATIVPGDFTATANFTLAYQ